MPALLQAQGQAGWPHLQRLLLALLRFMEPYLRNAALIEAVRVLYKACGRPTRGLCNLLVGRMAVSLVGTRSVLPSFSCIQKGVSGGGCFQLPKCRHADPPLLGTFPLSMVCQLSWS